MTPDAVVDLISQSLYLIVVIVSVIVGPSLVVGLFVSMFQAATQINEQTLSFLPRLLITLLTIMLLGNWLLTEIMDLFNELFALIPQMLI